MRFFIYSSISMAREFCYRCYRAKVCCLCADIIPIATQTRFVLLMHTKEYKEEKSGTGRFCNLSLPNSEIIEGIDFTNHPRVEVLIHSEEYYPTLLYPGVKSKNLSEGEFSTEILKDKKLLIFILDGTWGMAKQMMTRSKNLHSLPRLSFTPRKKSEFQFKLQPEDHCLSTVESIHQVIQDLKSSHLENCTGEDHLLTIFKKMVDYQVQCTLDPSRQGYRKFKVKRPDFEKKRRINPKRLFFEG